MNDRISLTQLLAADLPAGFVRAAIDVSHTIYRDAYDYVFNDPALGDPEANYLLGHRRRALFESTFRNLAATHGLSVNMERSDKGGCEHVRISAGRFEATICHVSYGDSFPKPSLSRAQYAEINEHISQGQLFPVESKPTLADIYGIIIHTEVGAKDRRAKLQSLKIGFPNAEFKDWVDAPIDFQDIADIQVTMYQKTEDLQAQAQIDQPRLKVPKSASDETNKEQH